MDPEDSNPWPLDRRQTLVLGAVLTTFVVAGFATLWSFGQQIIHVNELAAMRRCWANQYALDEALARLNKSTGVPLEGLEFNVDLMMTLVEARYLHEPVRDPEPDRRGMDGSWKYYRLRKDGKVECAYHGREPTRNRWNLDRHLPTAPPPQVPTPPRKPMPPILQDKFPLEPGDLEQAEYLQSCAEEL